MKSLRKMTRMATLTFLMTCVLGCNPTSSQGVEAAPASECVSDSMCPLGYFCHHLSAHPKKFCSPCLSCEKSYSRHPKAKGECAKNYKDCGTCLDGYSETHPGADLCSYNSESTENQNELKEDLGLVTKIGDGTADSIGGKTWPTYVVIGLVSLVVLVIVLCLAKSDHAKALCSKRASKRRGDSMELAQLHDESSKKERKRRSTGDDCVHVAAYTPTAPYEQQASYNNSQIANLESPPPYQSTLVLVNERLRDPLPNRAISFQQAVPFNQGNGSGEWQIVPQGLVENQGQAEVMQDLEELAELAQPEEQPNEPLIQPDQGRNQVGWVGEEINLQLINNEINGDPDEVQEIFNEVQENVDQVFNVNNIDAEIEGPGGQNNFQEPNHHGFFFRFNLEYQLGIFNRNDQQFNLEETIPNLSLLVNPAIPGPSSPSSSSDSGAVEMMDEEEDDDDNIYQEVVVPIVPNVVSDLEISMYEDENSYDSQFYEEAQGEEEEE